MLIQKTNTTETYIPAPISKFGNPFGFNVIGIRTSEVSSQEVKTKTRQDQNLFSTTV